MRANKKFVPVIFLLLFSISASANVIRLTCSSNDSIFYGMSNELEMNGSERVVKIPNLSTTKTTTNLLIDFSKSNVITQTIYHDLDDDIEREELDIIDTFRGGKKILARKVFDKGEINPSVLTIFIDYEGSHAMLTSLFTDRIISTRYKCIEAQ